MNEMEYLKCVIADLKSEEENARQAMLDAQKRFSAISDIAVRLVSTLNSRLLELEQSTDGVCDD